MAKKLDRTMEESLLKITGRRLVAARIAAGLKNEEASLKLGYHGKTQLSLAEGGKRFLPPPMMMKLANLYGVTLDYLYGRIDDPLADPMELAGGVIVSAVSANVQTAFGQFTKLVGNQVMAFAQMKREDRDELKKLADIVVEAKSALDVFVDTNPDFNDMPKASMFYARVNRAADMAKKTRGRHENEARQREVHCAMIDADLCLMEDEGKTGQQMQMASTWRGA